MAADLALWSVPDTPANRSRLAVLAKAEFFDDSNLPALSELCDAMTDHVEVGPVSFAKAAFMGDGYWIPGPVRAVLRVLGGEFVPHTATRALSAQITAAMSTPDRSHYRSWTRGSNRRAVKQFFERNNGMLVCAVVE